MIAADVNRSNSITTFDILTLRRLILGIDTAFANNNSWLFIPDSYVFPDTLNPFSSTFPTVEQIENWLGWSDWRYFTGVKVGDVNGSAIPDFSGGALPESRDFRMISPGAVALMPDKTFDLPFLTVQQDTWNGFQMSLRFDPQTVVVTSVLSNQLPEFGDLNWSVPQAGELRISWSVAEAVALDLRQPIFRIQGQMLVECSPSALFEQARQTSWPSEMYAGDGSIYTLHLGGLTHQLEHMAVYAARPNPFTESTFIPVELQQDALLELQVWDVQGRLCWTHSRFYEQGPHSLEVPGQLLPNKGCYYWRLASGQHAVTGKMVKE